MRVTHVAALIVPVLLTLPPISPASGHVQLDPPGAHAAKPFRFSREARTRLQALWTESSQVKAERVACIGGTVVGGVAHITSVHQLSADTRDSTHILAEESLTSCHPPQWLGTVHTHVAKFGGLPFVTFSPDDRNVMWLWRSRWKETGVFCVLYSERAAHCESGIDMSADPDYVTDADDLEDDLDAASGAPGGAGPVR